ncbi:MAG: CRISPR system precrRNA processing endoribonuclease RAMP protein Cas6 [Bryobacteraceae bacterium]|nr:CRISPR system precrRNA processing endoribonuclease RAMP protein Cas6 [Bryobacteraceae bacterium]
MSTSDLRFELFAFRFLFAARDAIRFPPGKAGNIVRGAFGTSFRSLACDPRCPGPADCERRPTCPYARIFEPAAAGAGPSGLSDWPRPFVFRASHLDDRGFSPGESFHFDVHLFDCREPALAHFVLAFAQLGRDGIGPRRGRADLLAAHQLGLDRHPSIQLFDGAAHQLRPPREPISLGLDPDPEPVSRVLVRFVTPTELKSGRQLAARPEFPILFGRIRDRLSTLRALYGPGPLPIDFRSIGARADGVRMTRCDLRQSRALRRSSRTGLTHPLGGFLGEAEYEGPLAEFTPFLRAAQWTGVGRQTVWGKGEVEVAAL